MRTASRLFTVCLCALLTAAALAFAAAGGGPAFAVVLPAPLTNTFQVDSTADSPDEDPADGQCLALNGHCTLRAAISQANYLTIPCTVTLPAGTFLLTRPGYGEDDNIVGDLDIKKDLTIRGAGSTLTIVDGNGLVTHDRVFHVQSSVLHASFSGLTIRNGRALSETNSEANTGGGISAPSDDQSYAVNLQLDDVVLADNSANIGGGLFAGSSTNLTIRRSKIYRNSAAGGYFAYGGGIAFTTYAALIEDSDLYSNTADYGGAIGGLVFLLYHVMLRGSSLHGNSALFGGGIYFWDSLYPTGNFVALVNSTVSDNRASHLGGGIHALATAQIGLFNSTVVGNQALRPFAQHYPTLAGGIYISDTAVVTAANSLIADNASGNDLQAPTPDDCFGPLHSLDFNLIKTTNGCAISGETAHNVVGQEPLLGPLQWNGGAAPTHAQLPGSPAIDAGNTGGCKDDAGLPLPTDQRGFRRAINGRCDIGAFEYSPFFLALPLIRR